MRLQQVDPSSLNLALRRLRRVKSCAIEAMVTSMGSKGQLSALVVAEHEGQLVLLDGFARQAAAIRLGMKQLQVQVLSLSWSQMKAQMYLCNRERGLDLVEECKLVQELCEHDGLRQVDVGVLLDRHKSWVSRRLSMYKSLSPRLLQQGVLEQLESGALRMLSLFPSRNQEDLMAVSQREGLTSQQTVKLLRLWLRAPDVQAKEYLMTHPQEALQLAAGKRLDPLLGPIGTKLHEALMVMGRSALQVGYLTKESAGGQISQEGAYRLAQMGDKTRRECLWALEQMGHWSTLQVQMGTTKQSAQKAT